MNDLADLIAAIQQGDADRVATLLDANDALAHQRDKTGATPLHYAALGGQREIARLLIERGADINSPDGEFGATPAGGRSSTCASWAGTWASSSTIWLMRSHRKTCAG